ncbi:Yip1 family protein [Roseiterribacter gracilis]|uniref:YIP1 family protein n=1 Tax=Roseiterribacter gracilis TaxID=2812848 RepID=A0A8S8XBE7_9PROT|nr:YIP1 family protein [Rhodospirillales bacterium TMPK1]
MTFESNPVPLRNAIAARAQRLLLRPSEEWVRIADEPMTEGNIYRQWVIPLAAIPPVCSLLGSLLFGGVHPGLLPAIGGAAVHYVLALVGIFVAAMVIDVLARRFGGARQDVQALKVAAFSQTAIWLAGLFNLIPALSLLTLLGLYSLYLLYTGLPICMRAPKDSALPYTAAVVVATIVIYVVMAALLRLIGMGPLLA